jgi:hypothetical protein
MKRFLLSAAASFLLLTGLKAQDCSDLFISEYVEGTGNNKALEIYNPTQSPISLANYRLIRWDNGNVLIEPFPLENVLNLPSNITMQPNTAYVIALNLTDPSGTGQNAPIDPALQAVADTLLCPGCATGTNESRVMCFNGDDALSLQKNVGGNWVNIDIFACIGERPSNSAGTFSPTAGWTILPPFSSMPSNYDSQTQGPYFLQYWTQDKTLIRKFSVKKGVSTNPAPQTFNASVEWDTLSENTFTELGKHMCECWPQSTLSNTKESKVNVYPNPSNGIIHIQLENFTGTIVMSNMMGQVLRTIEQNQVQGVTSIDASELPKGIYNLNFISRQGVQVPVNRKIVLQ